MISFAWPWVFWLLPLPLLARLLPPASAAWGAPLRLPLAPGWLAAERDHAAAPARWRLPLALLIWLLLVGAAARPEWLGPPLELPLAGRDLMLAIDVSGSMEEQDFELDNRRVSRMAAVKAVAIGFVQRREQDRIGLILFGSNAYVMTPLTFDRATVAQMLAETVVGLAGRETAIGDAIALAVKRLRDTPEGERVLILLTDGASNAGAIEPLAAAELAAEAGIRIHTIGVGGQPRGLRTPFGIRLGPPAADYDPDTLRRIAERTGGRFFAASDRAELEAIYGELDRLEPSDRDARVLRQHRSLFMWPAGAALILSVLLVAGPLLAGAVAGGERERR